MRIDPIDEVKYRLQLAERYLAEARRAYRLRDYRGTVSYSQLAVENAAKSIIAVFRIPSWSHDPSSELLDLVECLPDGARKMAFEVADAARTLASEHGRSVYGEPLRRLMPWDIYSKEDAVRGLSYAKKAFKNAVRILRHLGILFD